MKQNQQEQHEQSTSKTGQDKSFSGQAFFAKIIDTVPDIVIRTDLDGVIREVNQAASEVSGFERSQIVGRNMLEFIAPEDREKAIENTGLMFKEKLGPRRYNLLMKGERKVPFEVHGDVLRNPDGTPFGMVYICRDITDRMKVLEALSDSEQRYRSVVENSHDGIAILDDDYRIAYVNAECCRILAYSREELVGSDFRKYLAPETAQVVLKHYKLRQQGLEPPDHYEFKLIRKDGEKRWVETSSSIINDDMGNKQSVAQLLDITDRKRFEDALQEREERLRLFIENTPVAVAMFDRDMRYLAHSRRWIEDFRLKDCDLTGQLHYDVFPRLPQAWKEDHKLALAGQTISKAPENITGMDGKVDCVRRQVLPWRDQDGEVGGLIIFTEVMTDRIKAEQALQESEEKFRSISTYAMDAIIMIDAEGNVSFWNKAAQEIFGYTAEEIIGQELHRLIVPEKYLVDFSAAFANFKRTGRGPVLGKVIELTALNKDGSEFPVEMSLASMKINNQSYAVGIVRDITDRKLAEAELSQSEEKYRTTFQSMPLSITITELESGTFWEVNEGFEQLTGYTRDEVLGKSPFSLNLFKNPADRAKLTSAIEAFGYAQDLEIPYLTKYGRTLDVLITAKPIIYDDKECMVTIGRDVTPLREAEAQSRMLQSELQHAKKMEAVGTLAGGVAHDFNNVLQAISGYVEMLSMHPDTSDHQQNYLEQITRSTERASDLVRQLMAFSRKIEPVLNALDLNHVLGQAINLLERTIPKMISIEFLPQPNLQMINGDATLLEQVLLNLASNAKDAMPDGGKLTIETSNVLLDEQDEIGKAIHRSGNYVKVRISDTGHGMNQDALDHIFEPFYTTKEVGKGTGLGLASVYGIVQSHDGHISCRSRLKEGTTFTIYLPALPPGGQSLQQEDDSGSRNLEGTETILLIDDEKTIRDIGKEILSYSGYKPIIACNGEEALSIYNESGHQIDVIILDINMPGMGGIKCLKELLEIDPEAKVIIASGYTNSEQLEDLVSLGAAGSITKPFKMANLLQIVRELLDH